MSVSDFAKLCSKLQKKYGENPLDLPAPEPAAAAPASTSTAAPTGSVPAAADDGTVPASFDRQLQTLSCFYTKHDSAKAGAECRAILDKRRGDADAMSVSDFAKLCSKLQKKYGENPLDLPAINTAGAAAPAAAVDAAGVRSAPLVSRRGKRAGRGGVGLGAH
jgi:hypothetical protein